MLVEGVRIARDVLCSRALDDCRGNEYVPGVDVRSDDQTEFLRTA